MLTVLEAIIVFAFFGAMIVCAAQILGDGLAAYVRERREAASARVSRRARGSGADGR